MLGFKEISKEDLNIVIINTAQKMSVQETIIEKDYWVCFALHYLFFKSKWKDSFTFKGGTSLSKCFGLIERFSEKSKRLDFSDYPNFLKIQTFH